MYNCAKAFLAAMAFGVRRRCLDGEWFDRND